MREVVREVVREMVREVVREMGKRVMIRGKRKWEVERLIYTI